MVSYATVLWPVVMIIENEVKIFLLIESTVLKKEFKIYLLVRVYRVERRV